MVSFRGFGGYGKTTLARELVIYLIAKETERFFDEYHLISFKGKEQGDFDPATGQRIDPTHNMEKPPAPSTRLLLPKGCFLPHRHVHGCLHAIDYKSAENSFT